MALDPKFTFGALELTDYPFAVEFGSDRGSPEQVVAEVISALTVGSLNRVTHYSNRTVTIPVLVEGANLSELAMSEALLVAEARKPLNELALDPGDGAAPTSVFSTFEADLAPVPSDDAEQQLMRRYVLTISAHPWPRSVTKITTPAVVTAAPTVVDSGSSTTNWTATFPAGATLSVASGAVRSTYDPRIVDWNASGNCTAVMRRTAAINTSSSKYIAVDWKASRGVFYWFQTDAWATIGMLKEVRREPGAVAGFTRSWYRVPDSVTSVAWIEFAVWHPVDTVATSSTFDIDQVLLANALPSQGTGRQKSAAIFPGGSVSTEGDILIQHPTSNLGRSVIYTHPIRDGYSPPLRPWRTGGGPVTTNTGMVSGSYTDVTAPEIYEVPVAALPAGAAHLWVKMGATSTSAVKLKWSVMSFQGGIGQVGGEQLGSLLVQVPQVGPHYLFPIARVNLPPTQVSGPNGTVAFVIEKDASSSGIGVTLDEAWIFAMDEGTLTVVDAGTVAAQSGQSANRLRISGPSLTAPYGDLRVATAADWSDAWEPAATNILCDQRGHRFSPDGSMIFTVTPAATDAAVSLEHYRRWHTHAGS